MKRFLGALFLAVFFCAAFPASAHAALTSSQIDSILGLLTAFDADSATVARVRATLMGNSAPTAGTLWFGAGTQPTAGEVDRNSVDVPFTTITLSNNSAAAATIYTITVERAGSASDSSVRSIELLQGGTTLATASGLDSKHQATLAPQSLTVAAGNTVTLTLVADLSNKARSNKTLGLTVVALNASSPVSGVLPLTGTLQKID